MHKTTQPVRRPGYIFPKLVALVRRYVRNYHTCHRSKHSTQKPLGLLRPLLIPNKPWTDISLDFITKLPKTKRDKDSASVVIDRIAKEGHFIPGRKAISAEETAELMIQHVWRLHGLPSTLISDRGPQFVSLPWKKLCEALGIRAELSSGYHPETDGQAERTNQSLESYLRAFVNYDTAVRGM